MRIPIVVCVVLTIASAAAADEFQEPVRIEAGGEPIAVESPGFAAPTLADVDADGKPDLVVGQFNGGKMTVFRNVGSTNAPRFSAGVFLEAGGKAAVVPGVW